LNSPRNTIFWLLIMVLVGGAYYYFDHQSAETRKTQEAALKLFPFKPAEITGIRILSSGESPLRLLRDKETWWLKEPLEVKGDSGTIETMLKNIVGARNDGVLFEKPEPAKIRELGLDEPGLSMGFITASGETVINFGLKGPTHNVTYAQLQGDHRVFRIHSDVASEARKTLYDLRDKTIFDFDPMKIVWIQIDQGDKRMRINQDIPGKWDFNSPKVGPASMERVLETLYRLKESKVKMFPDTKDPLDSIGLNPPIIRLSLGEGSGQNAVVRILNIGGRDTINRGYFARIQDAGEAVVVEEGLVHHLSQDAGFWRD